MSQNANPRPTKKKNNRQRNNNDLLRLQRINADLEKINDGNTLSYQQISQMVKNNDYSKFASQRSSIQNALAELPYAGELRFLQSEVGIKHMRSVEAQYGDMPHREKVKALKIALMDAFPTSFVNGIQQALTHYGPALWQGAMDYAYKPASSTALVPYNSSYEPASYQTENQQPSYLQGLANSAYDYFQSKPMISKSGQSVNRPYNVPIFSPSAYDLSAINLEFILTQFQPEDFLARRPWAEQPIKTALATSTVTYPISTNASGAVGVFVFPKNMATPLLNNLRTAYIIVNNDVTFSPATGIQTLQGTMTAGPLVPVTSSIQELFLSGFSFSFSSQTSTLNQQGQIELIYWNRANNTTLSDPSVVPIIPSSAMGLSPYYQQSALSRDVTLRGCRIAGSFDGEGQTTGSTIANPLEEGFYMLVTSAPPSTLLGNLVLTLTAEFTPTTSAQLICPTSYANPGTATMQCLTSLFVQFPQLQQLSQSGAKHFVADLKSQSPSTHDQVLQVARNHFSSHVAGYSATTLTDSAPLN